MARVSYTVYKSSFLATICSIFSGVMVLGGGGMAAAGIVSQDYEMIVPGIIMFLVFGLGGKMLAEIIAFSSWWRKAIKGQNVEPQIAASVDVCFQVYNAYPSTSTLNKIQALNPEGANQIRQALAQQAKK